MPHVWHLQGRVCVRMCILSAPRLTYTFWQNLHEKDFFAWPCAAEQWYCWCFDKPEYVEYDLLQSGHEYLGAVVLDDDVPAPALDPVFSIFVFTSVCPAEVLPADDLPLSLPGDERSSGVTGGGDRSEPDPTELVGDKPQ